MHGKSLTPSLVLLTVTPVIVLVGLWAFAATVLVVAGSDTDPARGDELTLWVALGSILAGAVLIATCLLVWRYSRALTDRLNRLHRRTVDLAGSELPQLVQQLAAGDRKLPADPPADEGFGDDEVGRLAFASDQLRKAMTSALAEQARGRAGSEQVFLGLARRTQVLISRLIPKLDELERKHHDSDLLKDIFAVDHLATRVRRHTENLVILGGAPPVRRWSRAVPIYEVLRSAISETEDYRRVDAQPAPQVSLVGPAVADVVHLLAELIENGTAFSPPETRVSVSASHVANGLALEVEDRGLGMPETKYTHINRLLGEQPRLDMMSLGETPRLGLFVVARLARRHHLEVSLRRSHYGGTLAIVLLPHELLEETKSLVSNIVERRREESPAGGAGLSSDETSVSDTAQPATAQPAAEEPPHDEPALPAAASAPPLSGGPARGASVNGSAPPSVGAEPGIGAGAGLGAAAVPAAAGAATSAGAAGASAGDDYDGFPSYGGAGLLPSTPSEPATGTGIPGASASYGEPPAAPASAAAGDPYADQSPSPYHDPSHTPVPTASSSQDHGHGSGFGRNPDADHGRNQSADYRQAGQAPESGTSSPPPLPQRNPAPLPHERTPDPARDPSSDPAADSTTAPDGLTTPKTLPTRVRGENLAAPLRRSPDDAPEQQAGPPSADRAGAAIGAIQSANKRARHPGPASPPSPPSPASPTDSSTPAPPAGGNEEAAGPEHGTGSQES